ncbi:SGNH/GDSL hydrolase family protein [Paludisphaera mucosa]|uniref:SGNH/GDSL hydrolase family protein n=1 Tax=Paludisphaera mucosa TaxID=3030827 RepID=A0ABT6FC43_9BACT|nr:SGNH/GDSL hydrolase family protein [Paludisphaera mucosa]MDG3005102.1 SGNH/GDSL hydrolase family protein [Paludisphaera mucosa]
MDELKRAGCIRRAALAMALMLVAGLGVESRAGSYTGLVVFGDSLSDVGNTFAAATFPGAPYVGGRYSDGPIWVDYLAARLGIAAPTPSFLGGTDYAWGFAQSGADFSYPMGPMGPGVPNLLTQVGGFLMGGGTLNDGQLVSVWAGANDFLNNGVTDFVQVADNIITAITTLAAAGGTHFLVGNLPLLGMLPLTPAISDAQRAGLNMLTMAFNATLGAKIAGLQAAMPGLDIHYFDVNAKFQQIIADPAAFGLTNVTDGAIFKTNPADGTGYLFWDEVHPTTAVHALIADVAFAAVVPEPSSLVLAAIAGGSVLVAARATRSRRAA